MKTFTLLCFAGLALIGAAGCASKKATTGGNGPVIFGTVNYRARVALPPDAVLTIRLLDVSRADAPAIVLADKSMSSPGNVPIAFELRYPVRAVQAGRRITLEARIEVAGKLKFYSMTAHAVTPESVVAPHEIWVELVK